MIKRVKTLGVKQDESLHNYGLRFLDKQAGEDKKEAGEKTVWKLKKRELLMVIHGFWCIADLVQLQPVLPT